MSDAGDIGELLEDWPYDPENDARIIRGQDGREILQVRTPLGLEQLEMQGRPDGARPHGMESAFQFHQHELAQAHAVGGASGFQLSAEDCAELFAEGTLYYFRYLRLFQLKRWSETVRDTARNLLVFDFVRRHAAREEDRDYLEKWRPYLLRINAIAAAMQFLSQSDAARGLKIIREAREQIGALDEVEDDIFRVERDRSLMALQELENEIREQQPVSPVELLQRQLRVAVEQQEFERAAQLRDRIRALRSQEETH